MFADETAQRVPLLFPLVEMASITSRFTLVSGGVSSLILILKLTEKSSVQLKMTNRNRRSMIAVILHAVALHSLLKVDTQLFHYYLLQHNIELSFVKRIVSVIEGDQSFKLQFSINSGLTVAF